MNNLALTDEMISKVECPLCNCSKHTILFNTFDHEYKTTDLQFPMVQCDSCGLKFLSPRPNIKSLEIIYPPSYSNFSTADPSEQSYVRRISNVIQSNRIKKLIEKYHPSSIFGKLNILDVGCGDGHILDRVKEAYPNCNTYGVEPNYHAAQIASERHTVFQGVFENYRPEICFDIIFSSHVVEHVESPVLFLRKIGAALSPNGVAIIDTPNIACFQYRIFGAHWGGIHSPRHWTLFDTKTLALTAKKACLEVRETVEMPINAFWIWSLHALLYSKGLKNFADKFFNTQKCVSQKSFYYLTLMVVAELLERMTGFLGLGLGQQRMVLAKDESC